MSPSETNPSRVRMEDRTRMEEGKPPCEGRGKQTTSRGSYGKLVKLLTTGVGCCCDTELTLQNFESPLLSSAFQWELHSLRQASVYLRVSEYLPAGSSLAVHCNAIAIDCTMVPSAL